MIWTVSNPDQHCSGSPDASTTTVFLLQISLLCFIFFILAHRVQCYTCQIPHNWKAGNNKQLEWKGYQKIYYQSFKWRLRKRSSHLLYPFEHWRDYPRVLVDDSSKAFWKHSRYVIRKTTTSNMSYSFHTSLANNIKHLFQEKQMVRSWTKQQLKATGLSERIQNWSKRWPA